jgi:peptide-methionine (R)-S-oxide reductase
MNRRTVLAGLAAAAVAVVAAGGTLAFRPRRQSAVSGTFEVEKTEAEWRQLLTQAQFAVLRQAHTEAPFTSPLNNEHRKGIFACAGCSLPLYDAAAKFDSGTGWPSFFQPLPNAIATSIDESWLGTRTEVHCRRCGGHLGHVFDDGPPPTGLRYCMNGVALKFTPGPAAAS